MMDFKEAMRLAFKFPAGPGARAVGRGDGRMVYYDSSLLLGIAVSGFVMTRDRNRSGTAYHPTMEDIMAEDWADVTPKRRGGDRRTGQGGAEHFAVTWDHIKDEWWLRKTGTGQKYGPYESSGEAYAMQMRLRDLDPLTRRRGDERLRD